MRREPWLHAYRFLVRRLGRHARRRMTAAAVTTHRLDELAVELRAMRRLQDLSIRLLGSDGLQPLLEEILTCTMALQGADFGTVQLYNRDTGMLELVAQRNWPAEMVARLGATIDSSTPCGQAMADRTPVVVQDLLSDPRYRGAQAWCDATGQRAVLATPLVSPGGDVLGVLSTQFRQPHLPSAHELRLTDLLTRQAAQLVERKRVECALQRSQAHLAAAERLSHTGSWAWNLGRHELYWSDEMFALFGRDPATWRPSYDQAYASLHPDDRQTVRAAFEQAVQARREFECEARILRPDGSVRYIRGLSHPVCDSQGSLVEYVGTVTDITERKHAEQALAQAHDELAHLTRVMSMGELAASIAHEVNQPLAAIVTNGNACLRWLARQPPDLHEARLTVEHIVRDGIRAGEVIGRIRAFSRKAASHTARLDLNEAIHQAVALAQAELLRHQILLRLDLAPALPPVRGDRIQLQQVVLNLMMNGIEAMHGITGRTRELCIRSELGAAGQLVVAVRDAGIGLDPAAAERLFDAFFTTKTDGLGLGLTISRRIVEAHGGQIWAVRNEGPGATVFFALTPMT
jgi:PAS domain S-box-containing protein